MKREVNKFNSIVETVENVKEMVYYCEVPQLNYLYLSPVINRLFGPSSLEEHIKNPHKIFELVHPDDYETLEKKKDGLLDYNEPIYLRIKNYLGEYVCYEEYATPIYNDGKLVAICGVYRDISEKVKLQQLEHRATHDALTNLYNRAYFDAKFDELNEKVDVPVTIAICDLDNLKYVNDYYGHRAGDNLIKEAARIFKEALKEKEFVARIGGDEFAFMLQDATESRIEELFATIQRKIDEANQMNPVFQIELSKGYATHPSSLHEMEHLYMEADNRMYEEKKTRVKYRPSAELVEST